MGNLIGSDTTHTVTASAYATEGKGFTVGNIQDTPAGRFVYVVASTSITQYDAVLVKNGYQIAQLTTDLGKGAVEVAFAQCAFAIGEYGWVQVTGRPLIRVGADCDKELALFTTTTGGVLDDATTSVMIQGVVATTSVTGSTTAVSCVAQFPTLSRAVSKAGG